MGWGIQMHMGGGEYVPPNKSPQLQSPLSSCGIYRKPGSPSGRWETAAPQRPAADHSGSPSEVTLLLVYPQHTGPTLRVL